jgi:hypothetical protein
MVQVPILLEPYFALIPESKTIAEKSLVDQCHG